ncbi:hypothetical protein LVJ94_02480 [Pendulispora rubella]|uniref:Uncharacterized protein n=1 Tax=Pendulispora rubella TaxID=2741070 RepID=A0ABZ2L5A3_9BACT
MLPREENAASTEKKLTSWSPYDPVAPAGALNMAPWWQAKLGASSMVPLAAMFFCMATSKVTFFSSAGVTSSFGTNATSSLSDLTCPMDGLTAHTSSAASNWAERSLVRVDRTLPSSILACTASLVSPVGQK